MRLLQSFVWGVCIHFVFTLFLFIVFVISYRYWRIVPIDLAAYLYISIPLVMALGTYVIPLFSVLRHWLIGRNRIISFGSNVFLSIGIYVLSWFIFGIFLHVTTGNLYLYARILAYIETIIWRIGENGNIPSMLLLMTQGIEIFLENERRLSLIPLFILLPPFVQSYLFFEPFVSALRVIP